MMEVTIVSKKRIRDFRSEGFEVTVTGSGHLKLTREDLSGPVFTANTPSDLRSDRNTRALLKRLSKGTCNQEKKSV